MSQIPPLSAPALLKKRFGTLEVRDAGVAWTEVPDGGAPPAIGAVLVPFERVKSQAVNAATSNKVMLRLNLAESLADGTDAYTFNFPGSLDEAAAARDAFKDVIGAALKRAAAKSAQAMSVQSAMPTQEELSLRVELLSSDRALAKLHRELVMGELCTEEDFWELRQDVLANFKLQKSQKRGLPHGAAPESMAEAAAGAGKKLSLSKEKIQEIFAQNPTVYRAYQENVPNKLSEKEFWTRYVRDQMQRGGVGKDPDLLFGSISEAVEGKAWAVFHRGDRFSCFQRWPLSRRSGQPTQAVAAIH